MIIDDTTPCVSSHHRVTINITRWVRPCVMGVVVYREPRGASKVDTLYFRFWESGQCFSSRCLQISSRDSEDFYYPTEFQTLHDRQDVASLQDGEANATPKRLAHLENAVHRVRHTSSAGARDTSDAGSIAEQRRRRSAVTAKS